MPDGSFSQPQQRSFNPYTDNGGTILAIAGADFTVIAGDTRQSEGYSIQTRYAPKVFRLCVDHLRPNPPIARSHFNQNRPRCLGRKWLRRGREHVCEEGEAEARGAHRPTHDASHARANWIENSGTGTHTRRICPFAPSRDSFKQCSTRNDSSLTTFTTSWVALRRRVSVFSCRQSVWRI